MTFSLNIKTAEDKANEAAAVEAARIKADALAYLAATDWMVVRQMETGESIPSEITEARAAARIASD